MRTCTPALDAALSREDLTLCRLWEITFVDGRIFYYTDLSLSHVYALNTYLSDPGITVSTIRNSVNGGVQNATIRLGYSDKAISERDVKFGAADGAQYRILVVDYTLPDAGHMEVFSGRVVSINVTDRISCTMEVQGASAVNVGKQIGEIYSQRCRNVFGDFRCGIDLEAISSEFTILELISEVRFRTRRLGDETEAPEESSFVSMEYFTPGSFQFEVPLCDAITFEASSAGGGGAGALRGTVLYGNRPYQGLVIIGFDDDISGGTMLFPGNGGDAVFGPYTVKGGPAGETNRRIITDNVSAAGGGFIIFYRGIAPNPPQKQPAPLDYFAAPNIPTEVFPGEGSFGGASTSIEGSIFGGGGANGGKIRGTILVGQAGGIQVGDFIDIVVPVGGTAGGYPGALATNGQNGGIKFSYTRNAAQTDDVFNLGSILWISGANTGRVDSIAFNREGEIALTTESLRPLQVGDRGKFRPGCSNYADMCETRWNNLINIRAEPVVPQGAGTSSPTPQAAPTTDPSKPPLQSTTIDVAIRPENQIPGG